MINEDQAQKLSRLLGKRESAIAALVCLIVSIGFLTGALPVAAGISVGDAVLYLGGLASVFLFGDHMDTRAGIKAIKETNGTYATITTSPGMTSESQILSWPPKYSMQSEPVTSDQAVEYNDEAAA
jgi:hypothetical protein